MFFRNLTLFRFAESLPRSIKKLPSLLAAVLTGG